MDVKIEPLNPPARLWLRQRRLAIPGAADPHEIRPVVFRFRARAYRDLARRIGRNELAAIDVCRGYVEAQMNYASQDFDK